MSPTTDDTGSALDLTTRCEGVVALTARLEEWHLELCSRPALLDGWLDAHGSPVNVLDPSPMARNADELLDAAKACGVDLRIYFARKANKALALVDEAHRIGLGVDLASERELAQVLDRGVPARDLVMTAAVKPFALLELCITSGTTVVLDNLDEARRLEALAAGRPVSVALRLAPVLAAERLQTRFGLGLEEAITGLGDRWSPDGPSGLKIEGVHFHLDGYDPGERVQAIAQALELVDALRTSGHDATFIDIGGGIPMSYIDAASQWKTFWTEHRRGLLGRGEPLTFEGHGLGLGVHDDEIVGVPAVYPFHQSPIRGAWLTEILTAVVGPGPGARTVAQSLCDRGLQLRCEPGRALLDGCGLTAARVAHRKQRQDGTWLIALEMNRTQCRSTSADFLVDPLLLRTDPESMPESSDAAATGPIEGYLVGAYCIERELLTWRRMRFPDGVRVGDIVVFPNTAGYLMHILESSSHQIPLARNLVVGTDLDAVLDPIDAT